jgi:hypothetical protein
MLENDVAEARIAEFPQQKSKSGKNRGSEEPEQAHCAYEEDSQRPQKTLLSRRAHRRFHLATPGATIGICARFPQLDIIKRPSKIF